MSDTTSIYYKNGVEVPRDSLDQSTLHLLDSIKAESQEQYQPYSRSEPEGSYTPAVMTLLFFGVIAVTLVRKAWKTPGTTILPGMNEGRRYSNDTTEEESVSERIAQEYNVYKGCDIYLSEEQYDKILSKRLPYYRHLAPDLKEKFLIRTRMFLKSKTFLIKTDEPFVDMPVLVSGTAVQLTFGLNDFQLSHYEFIRIFPEEYFAKGTLNVLLGHVYGNTITLSWNHFLDGHEDHSDGVNLGLHEMAHALYYQLVHADPSRRFVNNFNEVMAEGAEMYELKHASPSTLFNENAYRNLQEFWAESVELFFERPSDLQKENAELFETLAEMLNQNPVNSLYPVLT
jgi:Mlc titration factor MtfA (ptsG expression regulator)